MSISPSQGCHGCYLNDVWMTEEFQILNLSSNLTDDIEALNLLPVQDFDGNFVLGDQVLANLDFSKGPIW